MITRKSEIPEWLISEAESRTKAGEPSEQIMALLRRNGIPKPYAMWVLKKTLAISMAQAQRAVHYSEAYADRRASDEAFHNFIADSFETMDEQRHTASAA